MIYLIGGNGFVGSAYARLFDELELEYKIVGRNDYEALAGTHCDVVINANGNSKKFLSDRDPMGDFDASVRSVMKSLTSFTCDKYVLLSSGDVYPDQSSPELTREDSVISPEDVSKYGLHKMMAENLVRGHHENWIVMRMGGFVGPNLKKNAIYDMLHDAPVWLSRESELQFIHTDRAARHVWSLVQKDVRNEIINLGAKGCVRIGDLHTKLETQSEFVENARSVRFELNLGKLETLSGETMTTSEEDVLAFVAEARAEQA
jgi:nucleoside-diphosphate-sugar epimerase